MKSVPLNRYVVFVFVATLGCAIDLATKHWIFAWLGMPGHRTEWLWEGVAGIQTSLNEGALFGFGQGWTIAFVVLSGIAAVAILYALFVRGAARSLSLTIALACVTSGILGNLYDRLGLPSLVWGKCAVCDRVGSLHMSVPLAHHVGDPVYAVRDWIKVVIVRYDWPNFNVADSLLVCGSILLLWHIWKLERCAPSVKHASAQDGSSGPARPEKPAGPGRREKRSIDATR